MFIPGLTDSIMQHLGLVSILNASTKKYNFPPRKAQEGQRGGLQPLIFACSMLLGAAEAVRSGHSHCCERATPGKQILTSFTQLNMGGNTHGKNLKVQVVGLSSGIGFQKLQCISFKSREGWLWCVGEAFFCCCFVLYKMNSK